jgi:hypothetical protein
VYFVHRYTTAQGIGEFILTHPNIQIKPRGKIYSFNEGNSLFFHEPVKKYLDSIKCASISFASSTYCERIHRPVEQQALQREIHRQHGCRRPPDTALRRHLWVRSV